MCFGEFHKTIDNCSSCSVVRSCKRESLRRLETEKQRQIVQKIKTNVVNKFDGPTKVYNFLRFYKHPVSTYRLTKDFKKFYKVNVSDTTILNLCNKLRVDGLVYHIEKRNGRYWHISR